MPTTVGHDATVTLLAEEFTALAVLGASIDPAGWGAPTCLPGWTVRDNLSHVIGTESMLLQRTAPERQGEDGGHVRNAIGAANEQWVDAMRGLSGPDMLARLDEVTSARLAALRSMTQADFDAPSWTPAGPNETYGRFMRIRHFDCFMHEHDMRGALGRPDRDDPAHVGSALDEVSTGLGFIVGKRAQFPTGASVRIDLTGSTPRTFLVQVAERAGLVDALDGEPTVQVELPAMLFLRLTGGREAAAAHLGDDVRVQGDSELGQRLIDNLAFTI
jgi:uncharacterized protein (TIGR03083 family)